MVITRKIEVYIPEDDKDLRRAYYEKLYANRDVAVKVANMAVSHLFALDNTMPYLSDEDKEKIEYLGCKGQKATKQNAPYVAASEAFKGKAYMGMIPSVLQNVQKMYQEDRKAGMWNRSLRSYKANMPVPVKATLYHKLRFERYTDGEGNEKEGCFFEVMGIPFQMKFGRDRSGNRLIVERVISGEYKMCTSSIQVDGKKVFLLLCVDIPKKDVKLEEKKCMYAMLSFVAPIVCSTDVNAMFAGESKPINVYHTIGTKEEFLYRRTQIQEAVKRCQINNRYSEGGKGRKKKCKAIDRWHEKEKHYVDTRLHTYSRMLIDLAVKYKCGTIVLIEQKRREEDAKAEPYILRNWSYYGLKQKIEYKAKLVGIRIVEKVDEGEVTKEFEI